MSLQIKENHKAHLLFLTHHPISVLQDFCRLAVDYINKGPNMKLYQNAAEKLEADIGVVENGVLSIVYLLVESCRYKLSEGEFKKIILSLEFNEEQEEIFSIVYRKKRVFISAILAEKPTSNPYFKDLQWRFESKTNSRALLNQVTPVFTMKLTTTETAIPGSMKSNSIILQTDPATLMRMKDSIEKALHQAQSSIKKTQK